MVDKVKMIIYDCDGVIFDSERANFEYYQYIFKNFNLPLIKNNDTKSLEILHTYSNDDVLKFFIKDNAILKEALDFSKKIDYSIFYKFMKIEKNFFKTCNMLKEKNIKITVATNRGISFKGIVKFFNLDTVIDDYITALDVSSPKPAPDMLLKLIQRNKTKNSEAIFIGDSILDCKAAESANIQFICYKNSINSYSSIYNHIEIIDLLTKSY